MGAIFSDEEKRPEEGVPEVEEGAEMEPLSETEKTPTAASTASRRRRHTHHRARASRRKTARNRSLSY